jgi:PAS domain S-box-containing protein
VSGAAANPEGGWPRPGLLQGYGVMAVAFAVGLANLIIARTPGPVATFCLVVILSAWFGGTRVGVVAIVVSVATLGLLAADPGSVVTIDLPRVAYFLAISSFVVWLIELQRRSSESLRRAHEELQRQCEALRRDNSAAKSLEETLRQSEAELRQVIDTIPTMAWICGPDGRLEFINRRWLDYSGLALEEALDSSNSIMHPDDAPRVAEEWGRTMANVAEYESEMRLRRADGAYRWFLVRTVPFVDADGKLLHWYGTSTDIEDRKRAEEAARRSERELREVLESIPVIAWTARPDGTNEYVNLLWESYTGLSEKRTSGHGWKLAVHPEDAAKMVPTWLEAVRTGAPFEVETRYRRADGTFRWFLVRAVPLLDDDGVIVRWYGVNTDIEDRKRAEQALRVSAESLQSLSRRLLEVQEEDRRHLARELHDEFGQLLAAIKLHLHAARAKAGEAARPSLDESVALLQRAGEQVRSLALELRPAILETAGLGGTLRWLARQHEQRTAIATEVTGQWSEVGGDVAIACFRVVQEALTNVARHAGARQVLIELGEDESGRRLTVRDDGEGFDVTWALEHAPGRGHLGLLGMRERVEILGGTLQIESGPGTGSRLTVHLPSNALAPAGLEP